MSAASRPNGGSRADWRTLDFALEEGLAVAGDDGLHDRVLRQMRLHEAGALGQRAAGAARDLVQELEGALAGPRVGALRQAEVAVDDADGREIREVMAFGDDLRADDDVGLALLDVLDDLRASR